MALSKVDGTNFVDPTLPVASGGTGLTSGFVNGGSLTEADAWRVSSDTSTEGDITASWERDDHALFGKIGTGMTESSGIFTFPSTGIWYITFTGCYVCSTGTEYATQYIMGTGDDASYTNMTQAHDRIEDNTKQTVAPCSNLIDVTSTSLVKVKFYWSGVGSNLTLKGASGENRTWAQFLRLGDT